MTSSADLNELSPVPEVPPQASPLPEDAAQTALVLNAVTIGDAEQGYGEPERTPAQIECDTWPSAVSLLPVDLEIRVPLRSFRVRDLIELSKGDVLRTNWPASDDLPFGGHGAQLLWAEFEVIDQKLAARITRLA